MHTRRSLLLIFTFLLFLSPSVSAQTTPTKVDNKNYDITLRIVFGSNAATSKTALPNELSPVVDLIKKTFNFSSFVPVGTFKVRLGGAGVAGYKSIGKIFPNDGQPASDLPDFLEWKLAGLTTQPDNSINFQAFRLGARIPLKTGIAGAYQYESIGLDIDRFGIETEKWVQIGTLTSPNGDGTAFILLYVKPSE